MVERISNAVAAYSNAANRGLSPGMEARDTVPGAAFGNMVKDMVGDAVSANKQAESVSAAAAAGKADLNEVVMAVSNAEVSLQTVVAIRDKVIEAYQEIIRMPV
ncbi:MAG: flagellar hook-basal body complex protein FliE [Inquilinaceae bacterium]